MNSFEMAALFGGGFTVGPRPSWYNGRGPTRDTQLRFLFPDEGGHNCPPARPVLRAGIRFYIDSLQFFTCRTRQI